MRITSAKVMYKGNPAILTIGEDVTQYRQALIDLHDAKEQAELYVDLMSHDISNFNQIGMGNLELLKDLVPLGEQGPELASKALTAFKNSSELISNVKKLRKVKNCDLHLEKMDIGRTLQEVKNNYLAVPGRDVSINLETREGCSVLADRLLYDVFSNIVDNSIKHSPGPIAIKISQNRVQLHGNSYCQVSIEDNGPGINPDLKNRIFNRMYYKGGIMRGKGLGLYLVKTLVLCFHGNITVEDRVPGDYTKGARFVVLLPAVESGEL